MLGEHFERVKDGANDIYSLKNLSAYVEKNINLEGKPYRFGDRYGFQAVIINDDSRVTNTVKPAQIGLTVSTMAYICSAAATQPKFNSIYSLPTTNDAQKLVATKLDPLIQGSPELKRLIDPDVNNNELKKIGNNFIFIRGSKSETAALSISADALVADEIDRSDPDTLKQFRSRLQASDLQIIKQFSTPTIPGVGISREASTSKMFRHFATCVHCGNMWLPSYHTDIVIPNYSRDLKEIDKTTIKDVEWQKARWNCPSCGKDPQLHPRNLQWVCENPSDNYEAHTYFVTPVTACLVLRPSYLVRTSTEFNTRSEWANQVLGETSEEANEQVTETDVNQALIEQDLSSSEIHYIGCDIGQLCALTVGRQTQDGTVLVVHRENVLLDRLEIRLGELKRLYNVVICVFDAFPETNLISRITERDPNAFGAGFVNSKNPVMYTIAEKEENKEEGTLNLRHLKVNRTVALDATRDLFKQKLVLLRKTDNTAQWNGHYTSMKRVQKYVNDELVYMWEKTDGVDHFMFSLMYLLLAISLRTRVQGQTSLAAVPIVKKFALNDYKPKQ